MTDDAPSAKYRPLNYTQRIVLTFIGAVAIALVLRSTFEMPFGRAVLVATPACLMVGSMFVLLHLALQGPAVEAKQQLTTLLIVEFIIVPAGAAVAIVAFFYFR